MQFKYLMTAFQLLTRLPVPQYGDFEPRWIDASARYFPLVGLAVGSICSAVFLAASHIWNGPIPALLAIATGVLVTGAFHEDGLADVFDAFGGTTRKARLEIMKDSRIGTFGTLALGIFLAIKVFALAALAPWTAFAALLAAHSGGRFSGLLCTCVLPYAGEVDAAKVKLVSGLSLAHLAFAGITAFAPVMLLPIHIGIGAAVLSSCASAVMAARANRLFGGYTGDVLGAVEQCYETGFLLSAAAFV